MEDCIDTLACTGGSAVEGIEGAVKGEPHGDSRAAGPHSFIAEAVSGPIVPVALIPWSFCHCLTAACVIEPKYPVGAGKLPYAL